MHVIEYIKDIYIEIIASLIIFISGYILSKIPKSINALKLKKFLSKEFFGDNVKIVYGMNTPILYDSNKDNPNSQKIYRNGRIVTRFNVDEFIHPTTVKASSYIIDKFSNYRKEPFKICSDSEAFDDLNNTFFLISGPISNELTDLVLNEKSNVFFKFNIPDSITKGSPELLCFSNNEFKKIIKEEEKDYGIILKLKNDRFKKHNFVILAGLGPNGTLGAAWYFSNYWKNLYKEFKSKNFGILLETIPNSETSTIRITPEYI